MDAHTSGIAKNRIHLRSVLIWGALYVWVLLLTVNVAAPLALLVAVYAAAMIIAAQTIVAAEIRTAAAGSDRFQKNFPFRGHGTIFGAFQHVFHSAVDITASLRDSIQSQLTSRTPAGPFTAVALTDVDKDIVQADTRTFFRSDIATTARGTSIALILHTSLFGKVHSVQWWVLARGYVDRDRHFRFLAAAPLTLPFWIISYLRRTHDVLGGLRTVFPGFYNDLDSGRIARCLHDTVFEALVAELDAHGIDTSDLKLQRAQVMNLNVSGGKVDIGNVVQGAANRVTAAVRKAAA